MHRTLAILVLVVFAILLAGCGGSDITCVHGSHKCIGDALYYCGYSGNDLIWHFSKECDNGCDSSTMQCKSPSQDNDSNSDHASEEQLGHDDIDSDHASEEQPDHDEDREPETRTTECSNLPENAEWNTVSSITQTKEGASWIPSSEGEYNTDPSTKECHYKCLDAYLWNGTQCVSDLCDPNPCWIENATGKCINSDAGKYECECAGGFFWNGEKCADPCEPNPCNDPEKNSTGICNVLESGDYSCGCENGYRWWNTETGCTNKKSLGNICTGQNTCYDNSAEITCPAEQSADFFGQDAYYASLGKCIMQSFTVQTLSDQKVILDNNTGLMWQQTMPSTTYTWAIAVSYCDGLIYAGYSDWRLPSPKEFYTISDNGRYSPAFDKTYFPSITSSDSSKFWTSQESKSNTSKAYYVGYYSAYSQIEAKTTSYNVMCVRGEELPEPVFTIQTISGEVVVTDSTTGLMWQKTYVTGKTWLQALKYCEDLSYAGYTDWRLPNKNEAASLLNYNKSVAPYSDFPDMPDNYFWSSSTYVGNTNRVWRVDFDREGVAGSYKTDRRYVRCVR